MSAPQGLCTRVLGRHWEHFEQLDSTNEYCRRASDRLPDGAVVTAAVQTAGRGRLGRGWDSAPGQGLALSVLLRGWRTGALRALPLAAGLAVCRGIEQLCAVDCALKWSNDVLVGERKVCGILCESRSAGASCDLVIGLGVNLLQTREELQHLGLVYASSLFLATGQRVEPTALAVSILHELEPVLDLFLAEGFSALLPDYRARCATLGREVRFVRDGQTLTGLAVDIAPDGALLCSVDGATVAVDAGETSVRGLYGYL